MAASPLLAVVVGSSFGGRVQVPALRAAGFDVAGLVGRDPDRTAARAAELGIENHGTSIADVVGATAADVVTVSTPPAAHCATVLDALGTGCHVLAEKPFALTVHEAQRMVDAADAAGVTAMVSFEFRWQPAEALIARAIANGDIGAPVAATFVSHSGLVAHGLPGAFNDEWWGDATAGGGILNAAGVHVLDRLHTWLDPVVSVSGRVQSMSRLDGGAEDTYSALMRTAAGVSISVQHCSAARDEGVTICKVIGTEGSVAFDHGRALVSNGVDTVELPVPPELVPPPTPDFPRNDPMHAYTGFELPLFIRLAERLHDEIRGAEIPAEMPPTPTFAAGLATQHVIDAIRASSADNGRLIEIPGARS